MKKQTDTTSVLYLALNITSSVGDKNKENKKGKVYVSRVTFIITEVWLKCPTSYNQHKIQS